MIYRFDFRPYQRKFVRPLQTSHGIWDIREGIIICLENETGIGWGEIAPISWFGSETLEKAVLFCQQLPREITEEMIEGIPDELPACQFGFESAMERGRSGEGENFSCSPCLDDPLVSPDIQLTYSGLLPAGEAAIHSWQGLWELGYRTFKWKIGVGAIATELSIFEQLTQSLPASAKLRLDANGGLSDEEARLWLSTCDSMEIEFIEQPLPVKEFAAMLELSSCYQTKIALDESVATLKQLHDCYQQGWQGIFAIKPGIIGSPSRLRQFCRHQKIDTVFSSVFETEIGRRAALNLAAELSKNNRAVGFGVNHWFVESDWLKNLW